MSDENCETCGKPCDPSVSVWCTHCLAADQEATENPEMRRVIVKADPGSDNCLADAEYAYKLEHRSAAGWDLSPEWADDSRESIALTVPVAI